MMGGYGGGYGGYGGYGASWLGMGMMLFFGLLVVVGVVLLVVWLARSAGHQSGQAPPAPGSDPCTIAKTRYARGEITKEQYEEMCRTLGV